MADNVAISAGSGTTIAADDIGGVMHQRVKLSLGADGTANDASAGAGAVGTGTQRVTLASDDPAVAGIGGIADAAWTSGNGTLVAVAKAIATAAADVTTPTPIYGFAGTASTTVTRPADTTAYTADDALSDSTSAPTAGGFTFSSMGRASGGSGILTDLIIISTVAEALQGELWIFDSAPTAINDNAAWALSDADAVKCVAKIPFTLVVDATSAIVHLQGLNIGYTCVGTANLRFLIKVKAAITPASATAYTFRAKFVQTN